MRMERSALPHSQEEQLKRVGDPGDVVLQCRAISHSFGHGGDRVAALKDVSLTLADGEFLCIVGPSGCGKTSLLKVIAGLLEPNSGEVRFGQDEPARPSTPLVFQDHGLFPWRNVAANVAFGLEMAGVNRRERQERSLEMINRVGLGGFAEKLPHQLSVGMSQRVAIARALLCDPEILLMDEPFGSLDAQTKMLLQEELLSWWNDRRQAVVYVTHDLEEAVALADRILVLSARPGTILDDIAVHLQRPRLIATRMTPEFQAIKARIWECLRAELPGGVR